MPIDGLMKRQIHREGVIRGIANKHGEIAGVVARELIEGTERALLKIQAISTMTDTELVDATIRLAATLDPNCSGFVTGLMPDEKWARLQALKREILRRLTARAPAAAVVSKI